MLFSQSPSTESSRRRCLASSDWSRRFGKRACRAFSPVVPFWRGSLYRCQHVSPSSAPSSSQYTVRAWSDSSLSCTCSSSKCSGSASTTSSGLPIRASSMAMFVPPRHTSTNQPALWRLFRASMGMAKDVGARGLMVNAAERVNLV